MTDAIFDWLIRLVGDVRIVAAILAFLPISEARLAIPVAVKYGLSPFEAFLYGFLGSSATALLLPLFLLPLMRRMSNAPVFRKIAGAVLNKAEKSADKMKGKGADQSGANAVNPTRNSHEKKLPSLKKMMGVAGFVAVPLPLTGVWTGSVVTGILNLNYVRAITSLIIGNFFACLIVTLTTVFFADYVNIIVLVFALIAAGAVIALLVKAFLPEKKV